MANTARPGTPTRLSAPGISLRLLGSVQGGVPGVQWPNGVPRFHLRPVFLGTPGVRVADGGSSGQFGDDERPGIAASLRRLYCGSMQTWVDRVHVMPRTRIDFGNIATEQVEDYVIHNASPVEVTETAIQNGVAPGVETPNNTPPQAVGKFASLLDPSSTPQTDISEGTPVPLQVRALPDGPPNFDGSILFTFPTPNSVTIRVAGTRIVYLPFEYEQGLTERLRGYTNVLPARDGNEQRIGPRENPRQAFSPLYSLDGESRQRFLTLLFDQQASGFAFPLQFESVPLTADVSAGAAVFNVAGADVADFRVGGLLAIQLDEKRADVLIIASKSATQITTTDPTVYAYPAGTRVYPARPTVLTQRVGSKRFVNEVEDLTLALSCTDNHTDAPPADSTPGFWSIYDGRVFLDDCNVTSGEMPGGYDAAVVVLDSVSGNPATITRYDRNKRSSQKGFVLRGRQQLYDFRRLVAFLNFRQVAFVIPTAIKDLTVVAELQSGTDTMRIANIGFERFARQRRPMRTIRLTFTDGAQVVRVIQSSAVISLDVEELTLDTTWGTTRQPEGVARVEFYELARLDTDEIVIAHEREGLARANVPIVRVFDDNA